MLHRKLLVKFPKFGENGARDFIVYCIALLTISLIVRFLIFLSLPNTPSSLGPDEMTYALLAEWVADGKSVNDFAYGPSLYNISKTFIIPSSIAINLGLEPLTAVRSISMLFGLISILIFILIYFRLLFIRKGAKDRTITKSEFIGVMLASTLFSLFPSHLLWSVIGMRETSVEFFLLLTTYLILRALTEKAESKLLKMNYVGIVLSVMVTFGTRPESAFVFVFSFFAGLILQYLRDRQKRIFFVGLCVALGTFLGHLYSSTPKVELQQVLRPQLSESLNRATAEPSESLNRATAEPSESYSATPPNRVDLRDKCDGRVEGFTFQVSGNEYTCRYEQKEIKQFDVSQALVSEVSKVSKFEYKTQVYQLYANSSLPAIECSAIEKMYKEVQCFVQTIIFRYFSILVRPLPIIDTDSRLQVFASLENLLWIFLLYNFVRVILKHRKILHFVESTLMIFLILYTAGMALAEGNMGTAFRHKSTILFVLLLLLRSPILSLESRARYAKSRS